MQAPLQAEMRPAPLRIAVVGAGVAGPALAAILGRLERPPLMEILERGSREMEQGGGYDLNNASRRVLEQAGVMHRYWEMTRPESNVMATWIQGQKKPFFSLTQPRWAHSCFGPKYETNRSKLREILLDAVEKHVTVRYNCAVERLRHSSGGRVELLDKAGEVLGEYDLVVDASGVGSSLRRYRVQESAEDLDPEQTDRSVAFRKAYTGVTMLHGVIQDPEASCHPTFVEKLGQGTVSILGPKGKSFTVQRFGADPADHRASFYYWHLCEHPDKLKETIGLTSGSSSQWHTGEDLEKMRAFVREDMGSGWEPELANVVDAIDFAAIRPILLHDRAPTFRENQLPLICVGDALHVVPPWTGSGGNLAMADASDLGIWLCKLIQNDACISIAELRRIESLCMARAAKTADDAHEFPKQVETWLEATKKLDDVSSMTMGQCADIFCEDCCKRCCFKSLLCCCRPFCNCCGCCRC